MDFKEQLKPFFWSEYNGNYSFCLDAGGYLDDVFETRADEGFEGNGYDWASLARVFLEEKHPELADALSFDPEAGMFCAYSTDEKALKKFALAFREACEDRALILELFSRAILD